MKRMVKLLSRRVLGLDVIVSPAEIFVLNQWWGHLLKQELECEDPTLLVMSCCVCFQNETQGRLGAAFPGVTSAILACVSLAVGRNLITVTSSRGKALAREGRGGRASLMASLCTSEFELRFCPHNVVTGDVLPKGVFKSFWQRGKGNLLSAVFEYWQLLVGKKGRQNHDSGVQESDASTHFF